MKTIYLVYSKRPTANGTVQSGTRIKKPAIVKFLEQEIHLL